MAKVCCFVLAVASGVGAHGDSGKEVPSAGLALSILHSCVLLLFILQAGP